MSKENKSGKAIFEERVTIVTEMLLSGLSRQEIFRNVTNSEKLKWDVKIDQVDNYISKANKIILAPVEKNREVLVSKCASRYDFLYKKLINVRDYKGAGSMTEKFIDLLRLNEADNVPPDNTALNSLVQALKESREIRNNPENV